MATIELPVVDVVEFQNGICHKIGRVATAATGYYVYVYNQFSGWCNSIMLAIEMIERKSGADIRRLPKIRHSDLLVRSDSFVERNPCREYDQVFFSTKEIKFDGVVQHKKQYCSIRRRIVTETTTSFGNSCVIGSQVEWLLIQNGYQLTK